MQLSSVTLKLLKVDNLSEVVSIHILLLIILYLRAFNGSYYKYMRAFNGSYILLYKKDKNVKIKLL